MRILSICLLFTASGCHPKPENGHAETPLTQVTYQLSQSSEEVTRILWQKSYPEAYAELIARSRDHPDPFAQKVDVPEADLVPGDFGLHGWGRAIVPHTFEALGFPLGEPPGSSAGYYSSTGVFEVVHTDEAIKAFESRFPEFTTTNKTLDANP